MLQPEGASYYAVFSIGAPSEYNYTFHNCWDAAIHSCSKSVHWHYGLFMAFFMAMATTTPEISWGLLAVDPDVAKGKAAVALSEAGLHFVCFSLYNNVTDASKGDDLL
jgi:hypothetical protein